jgi:hypothetical protein
MARATEVELVALVTAIRSTAAEWPSVLSGNAEALALSATEASSTHRTIKPDKRADASEAECRALRITAPRQVLLGIKATDRAPSP